MEKKKKIKITIAVVLSIVITISLLHVHGYYLFEIQSGYSPKSVKPRISAYTDVEIPSDAQMLYFNYAAYFRGLVKQYAVFCLKSDPSDWLEDNLFNKEKNTEFEELFVDTLRRRESILNEYYPDFNCEYYWLKKEKGYFVYELHNRVLLVYISNGMHM